MMEITCTIYGTVQGVRYRSFVEDAATRLGMTGCVKNNQDGTVTVVAQGEPDVLKELIEYLHEGSLRAHVTGVDVTWSEPQATYYDFSVLQ